MVSRNCPPWQNPRVLLALSLVFLCGAITGALVMRYGVQPVLHHPEPYWEEGGREISLDRLSRDLKLTPGQSEKLEMILDDFVMYVQMLQAQMEEVRANGKTRILNILDEDQKEKFEQMIEEVQGGARQ